MIGGGFGGSVVALVPEGRCEDLCEAVEGLALPGARVYSVEPAEGAGRVA